MEHVANLTRVDLVTANAVFDLFSQKQFQSFIEPLAENRLPFLATLNYQSMVFELEDQGDMKYVRLYECHMRRSQDFGIALGADCAGRMITIFSSLGGTVRRGKSVWNITSADTIMISYILNFMKEAITELLTRKEEIIELDHWINSKYQRLASGRQKLIVKHMDLFGTFSKNR